MIYYAPVLLILLLAPAAKAQLAVTTTSLPDATENVVYSASLQASGGKKPYTWTITTGSLPTGVTLDPSGVISGTPTQTGAFPISVQVTDSKNATASASLTLNVLPPPPVSITTTSLPNATIGVAYDQSLQATGGTPPYTWSGTPPAGLTLSSTGQLTGTPNAVGTFTFSVSATDAASVTATSNLNLVVAPPPLVISSGALPPGVVGSPYDQTLAASGGVPPYSWSGTAPSGLTMDSSGHITGTPAAAGTFSFTATVTDSAQASTSKSLSLTINPAALAITTSSLPSGTVGVAYDQTLAASGGTTPYTWSGTPPAGLTLDASGRISGSPTAAGTFNFSVTVKDATQASVQKSLALTINPPALAVTTSALPAGTVGIPYNQTLSGKGGTPPYTWSGNAPSGLSLSSAGAITGSPTTAGTFNFTVTLQDSTQNSVQKSLSLTISPPPLVIETAAALPDAMVGIAYNQSLTASGGTAPYTWSGTAPAGLSLSAAGQLTGTPNAAGSYNFTVTVKDAANVSTSKALTLVVNPSTLSIRTTSLAGGTVGTAYNQSLSATGGTSPYTWSGTGAPPGLTISSSGGLAGTPTTAGQYNLALRVTDAAGVTADRTLPLTIASALVLGSCPSPTAVAGQPYASSATASGGTSPYTWSIPSGQLPTGISLNQSNGAVSGTPNVSGNFAFTLRVTDASGGTASKDCSLNVVAPLAITSTVIATAVRGVAYQQPLKASGGVPPYQWTVVSGALPPGISLDPGGFLSGTPTSSGQFALGLRVTDSTGTQAQASYLLTVAAGLSVTSCAVPTGSVGQPYSSGFDASGGTAPYSWSILSGALPAGLALDAATGQLRGTPTSGGTSSFTVRVADQSGAAATRDCSIQIASALTISTKSLAAGVVGVAYSERVTASGGISPLRWSLPEGALPPGLSLNAGTGQITGTPGNPGSFGFTVRVTDAAGATRDVQLTINVTAGFAVAGCPAPAATVGQGYSATLNAVGGQAPYTWSLTGSLPEGLQLNGTTGVITGTPVRAGTFAFNVSAKDNAGATAQRSCNISVAPAGLSITSLPNLPGAIIGAPYSQALSAAGGRPPYTWNVVDGALPQGVTLTNSGTLAGTPAKAGTFSFTVRVTDADRAIAQLLMTLTVTPAAVPEVQLTGVTDILAPAQQVTPQISISAAYPVDIQGTLRAAFTPDSGLSDDPAVQFAGGGRSVPFTIPAGQTQAVFQNGANGLQTGTVAGTIDLTYTLNAAGVDISPANASKQLRIDRVAPRITAVKLTQTSGGFQIDVTGYATTRELSSATFRFTPASGSSLTQTNVTVQVGDLAATWFGSDQGKSYGSQFTLTVPFTLQGARLSSVAVSLTNSQGTSPEVTASF